MQSVSKCGIEYQSLQKHCGVFVVQKLKLSSKHGYSSDSLPDDFPYGKIKGVY